MTRWVSLFLLLSAIQSYAVSSTRCGGGAGPGSFSDVTTSFPHRLEMIETQAPVSEFLVHERTGQLILRDTLDRLFLKNLDQRRDDFFLGDMKTALSTVIDPSEHYIVTKNQGYYRNIYSADGWHSFLPKGNQYHHLFWNDNNIYSLELKKAETKSQSIWLYRYGVGLISSEKTCQITIVDANWKLAEGHAFPYAYFYETKSVPEGKKLFTYKLDVRTCAISEAYVFNEAFAGEIEKVIQYPPIRSTLIKIKDDKKHLIWADEGSCDFYDDGNLEPIALNYNFPIFATYDTTGGLQIYFIKDKRKVVFLKNTPFKPMDSDDLWLLNNKEELYLSPQVDGESGKALIKISASFR